jgi:hypothetical protein
MALELEQQAYTRELPQLLGSEGKFVLVHGNDVIGVYDTYADALGVGCERFGLTPFLVRPIQAIETVHHFTRDITPCPI